MPCILWFIWTALSSRSAKISGSSTSQFIWLRVLTEGQKELLGLWLSENEGTGYWLGVLTELQNRGVQDIFIACVDGLKGFPDAIQTAFPETHSAVYCARYAIR